MKKKCEHKSKLNQPWKDHEEQSLIMNNVRIYLLPVALCLNCLYTPQTQKLHSGNIWGWKVNEPNNNFILLVRWA